MAEHGTFVWNELATRDPERAKPFYAATLGWAYEPMTMAESGTYWVIRSNGQMVGGIFTMNEPMFDGVPEHWFAYVEVDDVDLRVKKVVAGGGQVIREPWTIPTVGRVAIVRDPGGAVVGWMTSEPTA